MPTLIPALWEVLRPPYLPIIDRDLEVPFVSLLSNGEIKRHEGPSAKVFFDTVVIEVEVPSSLGLSMEKTPDYVDALIRKHILKYMSQLYGALPPDFDGMFFGYNRGFSGWATKSGYSFNKEICLGYTKLEPGFDLPLTGVREFGAFPRVFDPSQSY